MAEQFKKVLWKDMDVSITQKKVQSKQASTLTSRASVRQRRAAPTPLCCWGTAQRGLPSQVIFCKMSGPPDQKKSEENEPGKEWI